MVVAKIKYVANSFFFLYNNSVLTYLASSVALYRLYLFFCFFLEGTDCENFFLYKMFVSADFLALYTSCFSCLNAVFCTTFLPFFLLVSLCVLVIFVVFCENEVYGDLIKCILLVFFLYYITYNCVFIVAVAVLYQYFRKSLTGGIHIRSCLAHAQRNKR